VIEKVLNKAVLLS